MSTTLFVQPTGQVTLDLGERLLHTCHSVSYSVSCDGETRKCSNGTLMLTSTRMILLSGPSGVWFPLSLLRDCHFEQPFFSANYFTAACQGLPEGPYDGKIVSFKAVFKGGGGAEFATRWAHASAPLAVHRAPPRVMPSAPQPPPYHPTVMPNGQAFINPENPNVAFAGQPTSSVEEEPPPPYSFGKKNE